MIPLLLSCSSFHTFNFHFYFLLFCFALYIIFPFWKSCFSFYQFISSSYTLNFQCLLNLFSLFIASRNVKWYRSSESKNYTYIYHLTQQSYIWTYLLRDENLSSHTQISLFDFLIVLLSVLVKTEITQMLYNVYMVKLRLIYNVGH